MSANPARLIYGTLTVAALLSAESARQETYPRTVAAVALMMLVYWLAHSYAEYTGERISAGERITAGGLLRAAGHGLPVLIGAVVPFVDLLICWALGATLDTAVLSGIWVAVAIIVLAEVVIGIRSKLRGRELVVQIAFGALLGLLVIAVRVLLH